MPSETDEQKLQRFRDALGQFIQRLEEDRYVLAVVLVGSLSVETVWRRESLRLWVIEADGVSRRLRCDGADERITRILVEDGINIHAELIPRSRFKQMVEGASRTAFSCNFFAARELVYSRDASIASWFEQANTVAVKDRDRELLTFTTWTIFAVRHARKLLESKRDIELAQQGLLNAAHSIAYTEIVRAGQIWEHEPIHKAIEYAPELFQVIYLDVLAKRKNRQTMASALAAIDGYLLEHFEEHLSPLLRFLRKQNRMVPLSEISDNFAFSQVYPWHLEAACEWLQRLGHVDKLSSAFKLTQRSQGHVEEPAYYLMQSE